MNFNVVKKLSSNIPVLLNEFKKLKSLESLTFKYVYKKTWIKVNDKQHFYTELWNNILYFNPMYS